MDKERGGARYTTDVVSNDEGGWIALELTRQIGAKLEQIARVVFWDAAGQFVFKTTAEEVPLDIIEELIAEAKQRIKVR